MTQYSLMISICSLAVSLVSLAVAMARYLEDGEPILDFDFASYGVAEGGQDREFVINKVTNRGKGDAYSIELVAHIKDVKRLELVRIVGGGPIIRFLKAGESMAVDFRVVIRSDEFYNHDGNPFSCCHIDCTARYHDRRSLIGRYMMVLTAILELPPPSRPRDHQDLLPGLYLYYRTRPVADLRGWFKKLRAKLSTDLTY